MGYRDGGGMSELKRISGVDINQDMDYQWREWRAQRAAWVVFLLIVLAGLLGLLGQGPLSSAQAGEPGSELAVRYERIDRFGTPTGMTFLLPANAAAGGNAQLVFSREFMDRISIEEIVPEPESVETRAEEVIYHFQVEDPAQPTEIRMDFDHEKIGVAHGTVRLQEGRGLQFSMFVWP
jgi:hypothetical protein